MKRKTVKQVQAEAEKPFDLPTVDVKAEDEIGGWGRDGLTERQRRFVKAYTGKAMGVGAVAAEMAGYRSDNRDALKATASRLLTYVNVQRAVARAFARRQGTKRKTLAGIAELANANIEAFLKPDGSFDLDKARAAGAMGAIKEIEVDEIGPNVRNVKVKLHDRLKALALLAKIHGTLIERVEHTGKDGEPIEVKHGVDYDAIEAELRTIGGRMAGGTPSDN